MEFETKPDSNLDNNPLEQTRSNDSDVDRVGESDGSYSYGVETDLSAYGMYVDRINLEKGSKENIQIPNNAETIYEFSGASSNKAEAERIDALKKKYLNKSYEPKKPVFKNISDPAPEFEELVTEGSGTVAKSVYGTTEKPNIEPKVLPGSLFIDGVANQHDIHQGNIGDCYFLAALLQIIHYDPNFFPRIMHADANGNIDGDTVITDLYHLEADKKGNKKWVRKPLVVKWGENQKISNCGGSSRHVGARYRLKYDPEKECKWSADFDDQTLKISKTEYYQAALWVNCLERVFADYSKLYGQYGTAKAGGSYDRRTNERYNNIEAGYSNLVLHMFFGDEVTEGGYSMPSFNKSQSSSDNLIDTSQSLVENLALLSQTQDGQMDCQTHISVSACYALYDRLVFYSNQLKNATNVELENENNSQAPDQDVINQLQLALKMLDVIIKAAEPYVKTYTNDKNANEKIADSVAPVQERLYNILKERNISRQNVTSLMTVLGNVTGNYTGRYVYYEEDGVEKGQDVSNNFYMVATHAYNIREVYFRDKDDNPIDVGALYLRYVNGKLDDKKKIKKKDVVEYRLNFRELRELVDLDKSYAIIQNPWGTTKAARHGQYSSRSNEGTWMTSLRELLVAVTDFTSATVKAGKQDDTGKADVIAIDGIRGTYNDKQE